MPPVTSPRPTVTPEGQAAASRIAQARQGVTRGATPATPATPNRANTSIRAADIGNAPAQTTPPQPTPASIPNRVGQMIGNVTRDTQGFIVNQSAEAAKARELADTFGALNNQGSLADMMRAERSNLGIDTNLKELQDIQLQLTDIDTGSALTKTRIEGGAGQTVGQSQREVTQEDRENAVRTSGLAARAAVLQGNINTATQLARDTVDLAFKDRQLKAENLLNQLNYFQGISDDQTGQLLEQDKRQYEEELANIKDLKDNIANAMVNGASQAEITRLNDANLDDASKLALAQSITARGAGEMRGLDIQAQRANIAQSQASTANIYDQIAARGQALRQAQSTATTEQEKSKIKAEADTDQALSIKQLANELLTTDGLSAAIGVGFKKSVVGSLPFVSGDAISGTNRADFEAKANRLANLLTLDNLKLMSGVLTDRDIQLLATAGSNLGQFNLSEVAYKAEINRVIATMDRTIGNNGMTTEQAVFFNVLEQGDAQTFDAIWDNL